MKYSPEFQYVWQRWPKRWIREKGVYVKRKKIPAWKKWQTLAEETHVLIMSVIYQAREQESGCPRDLVTWLNQEGWEDLDLPEHYEPVLPDELTQAIGHAEAFKEIDPNLQRTIQLRKLNT